MHEIIPNLWVATINTNINNSIEDNRIKTIINFSNNVGCNFMVDNIYNKDINMTTMTWKDFYEIFRKTNLIIRDSLIKKDGILICDHDLNVALTVVGAFLVKYSDTNIVNIIKYLRYAVHDSNILDEDFVGFTSIIFYYYNISIKKRNKGKRFIT